MDFNITQYLKKQGINFYLKVKNIGNGHPVNDIAKGLQYCHARINANTSKTMEASFSLYALIELLDEKGLLTIEKLDECKKQVAERLVQKFKESGMDLMFQDLEYDKYSFEHESHVDCLEQLPICKAICCKFPFALSKQDVEEGIISWNFGRSYLIAHDGEGWSLCASGSGDISMYHVGAQACSM